MSKPTREIPCDCGDTHACWRDGFTDGHRVYCCDSCWDLHTGTPTRLRAKVESQAAKIAALRAALVELVSWTELEIIELQRDGHVTSHLEASIRRAQKELDK